MENGGSWSGESSLVVTAWIHQAKSSGDSGCDGAGGDGRRVDGL